ncbi:hypothetical protein [Streptomyces sp. NPDC002537]
MTATPPTIILDAEAVTRGMSRGLTPRDEEALQALEEGLRALIEALIPLVEAAAENRRRSGFGDAALHSAVAWGRRLLTDRTINADPSPAPEAVVHTLTQAAKSLLYYARPR